MALRQKSDVITTLEPLDGVLANGDVDATWSPVIAAFVPGGAGPTITADVAFYKGRRAPAHRRGRGQPAHEAHGDKAIVLRRQSDDLSDPRYNLYMSDAFTATYNMNKDATQSPAPLLLASDYANAQINPSDARNAAITWIQGNTHLVPQTTLPYLGVDFVDTSGNSLPAIDAMSLRCTRKPSTRPRETPWGQFPSATP